MADDTIGLLDALRIARAHRPQGAARQNAAIVASGDRRLALSSLALPTLVIHGTDDPLIPVEAGQDVAGAIPGARLLLIDGMGHDMPTGTWKTIITAVARNAKSAAC